MIYKVLPSRNKSYTEPTKRLRAIERNSTGLSLDWLAGYPES